MDRDLKKIPLVFITNKPVGLSSFNVVYHFKKNLNFDYGKIGHFGTLDPFAEGVLLIGIQGAQKLNDYIHQLLPKTYRAHGVFGGKTQTGDLTSPIILEKNIELDWQKKSATEIEDYLCKKFLGEYWQSPHAVSAVKFEGKRLYKHALAGRIIEKEKVKREIYDFKVKEFNYPELIFEVTVSSGTYVRSLFEEIAEIFGGLGALKKLIRLSIGELSLDRAIVQPLWPAKTAEFDLNRFGIELDQVLSLDQIFLDEHQTVRYLHGQRYPIAEVELRKNTGAICSENYVWVYNPEGVLLGFAKLIDGQVQAIFNLLLSISQFC